MPLAGGEIAFSALELVDRERKAWLGVEHLSEFQDNARIDALQGLPAPFAGVAMDVPCLMGVVNVTPDSFSDGGRYADTEAAIAHGLALAEAGAAIVDVGGESTRPGAAPIDEAEERRRALPVVQALAEAGLTVSIDTRNPATMRAAAEAGAAVINDVTALTHHPDSAAVAADTGLAVVLMHSLGDPRVMQDNPTYDHVVLDIYDTLAGRIEAAEAAGIPRERIAVDPGFGFGKTPAHNLRLIAWAAAFHGLGVPLLIGVSRKSTIARIAGGEAKQAKARLPGSLALALAALDQGAQILRVHDVPETAQALALWRALGSNW
ncbi:MAG: dihydropteroate synthase [Alphaproteobacteria bacterium]|nr:dihydropteroate synthase [Alphaproteobacteria bacterium]